jgi:hypothetical protein
MRRSGTPRARAASTKVSLLERENLGSENAGRIGPAEEGDDENDHPGSRLQHHDQQQHDEELRHADHQVDETHQEKVGLGAGKPGGAANNERGRHDNRRRRDPDRQ